MRYAGLIKNDFTDGNGVCVSFWVQGCSHHCPGCHNSETWDFEGGKELPEDYLDQIDNAITANGLLRNFSLLGGEPFDNILLSKEILKHVREKFPTITIYCWTGYTIEQLKKHAEYNYAISRMLDCIDILIDGPYIAEQRDITLPLRGSRNQRILYKGKDF